MSIWYKSYLDFYFFQWKVPKCTEGASSSFVHSDFSLHESRRIILVVFVFLDHMILPKCLESTLHHNHCQWYKQVSRLNVDYLNEREAIEKRIFIEWAESGQRDTERLAKVWPSLSVWLNCEARIRWATEFHVSNILPCALHAKTCQRVNNVCLFSLVICLFPKTILF